MNTLTTFPFSVKKRIRLHFLVLLFSVAGLSQSNAQLINNNGCVGGTFGIDAGLYSNQIEFGVGTPATGSKDWFFSSGAGLGVINESNTAALLTLLQGGGNPTYETRMNSGMFSFVNGQTMIDAVWARDDFGGTGFVDGTSFNTASKNGEDPAIWDPGPQNVLGKNDLIDIGGYMFRTGVDSTSDLWFVGLINRAEPGGDAYMDFEFFVTDVTYTPGGGFNSGGPQLGHTAFTFDGAGNITKIGDFLLNIELINGGTNLIVELRLWVSKTDFTTTTPTTFSWGPSYDGAFTGSPYGYASIIHNSEDICGIVNTTNQHPAAPPWGTLNTKSNTWGTFYNDYSVFEMGVNLTKFGIDHASLTGADPCFFPILKFIVKTRASNSFTAQLKDFAGPFSWGQPSVIATIVNNQLISCQTPTATLTPIPLRADVDYLWTTLDGEISGNPAQATITVSKPGTYVLHSTLPTSCIIPDATTTVSYDPTKPFFDNLNATSTVSCSGSNGTINLNFSGGTPPVTFLWSNGATIQNPAGLAAGTYSVTLTDALGCTKTLTGIMVGARVPTLITFSPTAVSCFGYSNGSMDATVTGKSPFTYLWSTGATTEYITGLSAGTFTLTATDADGCTQTASTIITQPAIVTPILTKVNDTDPGAGGNGSIDLSISGGTSPYTYDWSINGPQNPDTDLQDLTILVAGIYTFTITDANGCTATLSTIIYEPEKCGDGIDNDEDGLIDCYDPDCQPSAPGTIVASLNPVCVGNTDITYIVPNTAGYTYNWIVPAGANITAGTGTNQITVTWVNNAGGQICVKAVTSSECISAGQSCLTIILQEVPPQPGTIIKGP